MCQNFPSTNTFEFTTGTIKLPLTISRDPEHGVYYGLLNCSRETLGLATGQAIGIPLGEAPDNADKNCFVRKYGGKPKLVGYKQWLSDGSEISTQIVQLTDSAASDSEDMRFVVYRDGQTITGTNTYLLFGGPQISLVEVYPPTCWLRSYRDNVIDTMAVLDGVPDGRPREILLRFRLEINGQSHTSKQHVLAIVRFRRTGHLAEGDVQTFPIAEDTNLSDLLGDNPLLDLSAYQKSLRGASNGSSSGGGIDGSVSIHASIVKHYIKTTQVLVAGLTANHERSTVWSRKNKDGFPFC